MANWKTVTERSISFNFMCECCEAEAIGIGPEALSTNGSPMCRDCDDVMILKSCEFDTDTLL